MDSDFINIKLEQALLGCLIFKNLKSIEFIEDFFNEKYFSYKEYKNIYVYIVNLLKENKNIDNISIDLIKLNFSLTEEEINNFYKYSLNFIGNSFIQLAKELKNLFLKRELFKIRGNIDNALKENDYNNIKNELNKIKENINNFQDENNEIKVNTIKDNVIQLLKEPTSKKIKIGFDIIDKKYNFYKKSLVVLAGVSSSGKTTTALNFLVRQAMQGKRSLFFSLEMSAEEITKKILCIVLKEKQDNIYEKLKTMEKGQLEFLKNIEICDKGCLNVEQIETIIRRSNKEKEQQLDFICIDHLQLFTEKDKSFNEVAKYGYITNKLKDIAKQYDLTCLLLSQLSRSVEMNEKCIPQLSNLRSSGDIEQNADMVIFVYRKSYYLERNYWKKELGNNFEKEKEYWKNRVNLLIKKNRNGLIGNIELFIDLEKSIVGDCIYEE